MPSNSLEYQRKNYKRYWGKKKEIKYRTKLNQANRERGDYGNGDNRDLMHQDDVKMNFAPKNLKPGAKKTNRRAGVKKAIRTRKTRKARGGKY